jgi:hypothetical protein
MKNYEVGYCNLWTKETNNQQNERFLGGKCANCNIYGKETDGLITERSWGSRLSVGILREL